MHGIDVSNPFQIVVSTPPYAYLQQISSPFQQTSRGGVEMRKYGYVPLLRCVFRGAFQDFKTPIYTPGGRNQVKQGGERGVVVFEIYIYIIYIYI